MCFKPIQVLVFWDARENVWIAECEDVQALSAKASSREALFEKLDALVRQLQDQSGSVETPVEIIDTSRDDQVRRIIDDVKGLRPDQVAAFRNWFYAYDAELWDRRIEADASAGKLDGLAEEALAEYRAGKAKPL
jgi:hypothetical protein